MGLDCVEIVIAVENSFQISLGDDETREVRTAGELLTLVLSKLEAIAASGCLTSYTFYRVRSTIVREMGLSRRRLSPGTSTEALIPVKARRAMWRRLDEALGLHLPSLVRSSWVAVAVTATSVAPFVASAFVESPARWLLMLSVVPVAYASVMVTRPLATHIPPEAATLRDLTQTLTSRNFAVLANERRGWREVEVWDVVRALIAEQAGLAKGDVKPETRFVEDLGW